MPIKNWNRAQLEKNRLFWVVQMGSAVPKWFGRDTKNLACRADILAHASGVYAVRFSFSSV